MTRVLVWVGLVGGIGVQVRTSVLARMLGSKGTINNQLFKCIVLSLVVSLCTCVTPDSCFKPTPNLFRPTSS